MSAVFKLDLLLDSRQLMDSFQRFTRELISNGVTSELKSLIFIDAKPDSIIEFLNKDAKEKDENLDPALKAAVGLIRVMPFVRD